MKYLSKFSFLLLLAAGLFVATGCGDDTTTVIETVDVSGTVSDDLGNTLEGVDISSDLGETTTTDASGAYSFTVGGGATLSFSLDGYRDGSATVSTGVDSETIDVALDRGPGALFAESFDAGGNKVQDPSFAANSIQPTADLGAAGTGIAGCDDVSYKGAIDPSGTPWYEGWSFYDNLINGDLNSDEFTTGTVVDVVASADGVGTTTWTANNTYVLDGFVFVNEGQTLTIEAGTVIQGKPGEGAGASALVVARGGKIVAHGTAAAPIIFTYEGDNGGSSAQTRGEWGGLIILGNAGLNTVPAEQRIEGIPETEARGVFGGSDDADDSGVLRYVSIRHGGSNIGADNEINGLTLGGVGTGTEIEYVEVVGNLDDGIEWFGGTVNAKYLISAFCGDDALDYDMGYRGNNQFVVVHQDATEGAADRGGEHDGGTDPEDGTPFALPTFCNVTSIGNADSRAITFRDNAGGFYHNSIFVGFNRGIDVEDLVDAEQDSYKQFEDGNLALQNDVFFNIGAGDTASDIFKVSEN